MPSKLSKQKKQLSLNSVVQDTEKYIELSKTQLSSEKYIDFLLSNIEVYHSQNQKNNRKKIEIAVFSKYLAEIFKASDQLDLSLRYLHISLYYLSLDANNKPEINGIEAKIKLIVKEKELNSLIANAVEKKEEGLFLDAIEILNKATELATKLYGKEANNKFFLIYTNLGESYEATETFVTSLLFYKKSLIILKIIDPNNNEPIIALSKKISFIYIKSAQYYKANELLSTIVKTYKEKHDTYINNYIANLLYKISLAYKESNSPIRSFIVAIKSFQISCIYPDDALHTQIGNHLISITYKLISLPQFNQITLEFLLKKISISVSDCKFTNGDYHYNLCKQYIHKGNNKAYREELELYNIFKESNPLPSLNKIFTDLSKLPISINSDRLYINLVEKAKAINAIPHTSESNNNDLTFALSFFFIKELVEEPTNIDYFTKEMLHINYTIPEFLNNKALWIGIHLTTSILGATNIPNNIINYKQLSILLSSSSIFASKLYWNDYLTKQHKLMIEASEPKSIEGLNDFIEQCAPSMVLQAALFYSNNLINVINLPVLNLAPAMIVSSSGIECYKIHNDQQ